MLIEQIIEFEVRGVVSLADMYFYSWLFSLQ